MSLNKSWPWKQCCSIGKSTKANKFLMKKFSPFNLPLWWEISATVFDRNWRTMWVWVEYLGNFNWYQRGEITEGMLGILLDVEMWVITREDTEVSFHLRSAVTITVNGSGATDVHTAVIHCDKCKRVSVKQNVRPTQSKTNVIYHTNVFSIYKNHWKSLW